MTEEDLNGFQIARSLVDQGNFGPAQAMVADRSFAALDLLAALGRRGVVCVTRLRRDAALYTPPPPRPPGTVGRPRTKGKRLPNLSEVLVNASSAWQRVTVQGWYGEGERSVDLCSGTAVWRHAGLPVVPARWVPARWVPARWVPARWVLVRDPLGRFTLQALPCTDPGQNPEQILRWFVQRWQLEATFQETRAHLGVERSVSGRTWPSRAPPPACSGCSPLSPCWPPSSAQRHAGPS